jgi:ectoine hydroxylase-related dioxygenase (phytanoyl-CoA dioxygenase family)
MAQTRSGTHDVDLTALRTDFERDGFVALEGLIDPSIVEALRNEATSIATGGRGSILGTDVVAETGESDEGILKNVLAIHFPHKASPMMRDALSLSPVIDVLRELVGPDIKAMQSMLFVKNAGKPGQAWHQDEYYIPTRDRSLIGVWIALDDATIDNGCLWMLPGSHRHGIIWPTKPHGDPRFDNSDEAYGFPFDPEGGVPVELAAGGVAFFNGYTLHRSLDNKRPRGFRRALVNHYMNARSMLPWSFGMPPTPRTDFRDIVMVAGEDPYAYKGLEEITFPFIRPEDPEQARPVFGSK